MAQSIEKFKKYVVGLLDEVYKAASKTAVLDGASELASQGANADELVIPKIDMDGLGDYDRNSGYTQGDVTFTNETVKCNFDRGRMFTVDNVDNMDTAGMAFGRLSSEFIRTKVVPELDAFRLAKYAGVSGADVTAAAGSYANGEAVRSAIAAKYDAMTDAEVPEEGRHLFITPTLAGMIRDMDTTKSKELLGKFASVQEVPQARFYTAIDQLDGKTEGQKSGGFKKADHSQEFTATASQTDFVVTAKPAEIQKVLSGSTSVDFTYDATTGTVTIAAQSVGTKVKVIYNSGANLNFMIIHKDAVIQYQKHVAPKTVTPEQNQDADAYKFGYRNVGIADNYANKAAGIAGEYAAI